MVDLKAPLLPVAYASLFTRLASSNDEEADSLLTELRALLSPSPDARMSLQQMAALFHAIVKRKGDQGLGFRIGLESKLTSHGFVGYGLMSALDLRSAIEFSHKFVQLRVPFLQTRSFEQDGQCIIEVRDLLPPWPQRQLVQELIMVSMWRCWQQLGGQDHPAELHFDFPLPDYIDHYRPQLPSLYFEQPAAQLRFAANLLDRPLPNADPATAQLVNQQCEQELISLGLTDDFIDRVRAAIGGARGEYADMATTAERLHLSTRNLSRQLHQRGSNFRQLQLHMRIDEAKRLLRDPRLSIARIAERCAYSNPVNFSRTFTRNLGMTPSEYRQQLQKDLSQ